MATERIVMVKRTLWVFTCPVCSYRKEYVDNPPKELRCPSCSEVETVWIAPTEESFTGPDKFGDSR